MNERLFDPFRLVGRTSLSLQIGHRMSIGIDLFTDASYGDIDFKQINDYLRHTFTYVSPARLPEITGMGTSYILGSTPAESFKLDLFYTTDPFIFPALNAEGIRMASKEGIVAMKIDVVQRGGRKKDFWDIHALLDDYTVERMLGLHKQRYPYSHDATLIIANFTDFAAADEDFDPICLFGKY